MKKRWLILAGLLILWLVITLYFYNQNRIVIKTMSIPGWELNQKDHSVQIKEIRLINKVRKDSSDFAAVYTGAYGRIFASKQLPLPVQQFLLNILSFYTPQYETKDAWVVEVSGVYLLPEGKSTTDLDSAIEPDLTITADGKYLYSHGITTMGYSESNFRFFTVRAFNVNPKVKNIELQWDYANKSEVQKFKSQFDSKTYNFFNRKPRDWDNFSPADIVSDSFYAYQKNSEFKAGLNPQLAQKLNWTKKHPKLVSWQSSVHYEATLAGLKDIFVVTLNYNLGKFDPKHPKIDGSQDFYLTEKQGHLQIIDLSDFRQN